MSGVDAVRSAVDALVAVGVGAGEAESGVRAEAAALSAVAAQRAPGAAEDWTAVFGGRTSGFEAAARAGAPFTTRATPVLARLVARGDASAPAYAAALAELASAACSLGEPSLSVVGTASVIAAAQTAALPVPPPGFGREWPHTPTDDQKRMAPAGPPAPPAPEPEAAPAPKTLDELLAELDALVGLDDVKTEVRHQAEVLRVAAPGQAAARAGDHPSPRLRRQPGHRQDHRRPAGRRHLPGPGRPGKGAARRVRPLEPRRRIRRPDRAEDRRGMHQGDRRGPVHRRGVWPGRRPVRRRGDR